ncbi:MAG: helix-turn-helix transcriptional regulator [Leucobacter sp.]
MQVGHPNVKPNALVDAPGLAAQLGLSVSSVYRKRSLGEALPRAVKIGSQIRWRQEEINEFLEANLEEA